MPCEVPDGQDQGRAPLLAASLCSLCLAQLAGATLGMDSGQDRAQRDEEGTPEREREELTRVDSRQDKNKSVF